MQDRINVVVVDNSCDYRRVFRSALLAYNRDYNIEYASDGKTAIELCKKYAPEIVITDILLPGADGLSVLECVNDPKVVKIASSLSSSEFMLSKAFEFGADYVFVKPLDERIVKERLADIIDCKLNSERTQKPQPSLSQSLSEILTRIGIPPHIQGFKFLKCGIMAVIANEELLSNVTGRIYPLIAEKFNSTPIRVERNIRTSIEVAYSRGNTELQNEIFGYTIDANRGKPTNSEFIAMIADRVVLDYLRVD